MAQALGVSPAQVRDWIAGGKLSAIRVGEKGRLRIHESALAQAIRTRQAQAKAGSAA